MPFPLKIISFSLAAENDKGVKKRDNLPGVLITSVQFSPGPAEENRNPHEKETFVSIRLF
ncbi:MAG: hypothetical protein QOG27_1465 [Verrucomicrobiota bacterium]